MRSAARLGVLLALYLALVATNPTEDVAAYDQGKLVAGAEYGRIWLVRQAAQS